MTATPEQRRARAEAWLRSLNRDPELFLGEGSMLPERGEVFADQLPRFLTLVNSGEAIEEDWVQGWESFADARLGLAAHVFGDCPSSPLAAFDLDYGLHYTARVLVTLEPEEVAV